MRAVVICNPTAGQGSEESRLRPALEVLERAGWDLTIRFTTGVGDATHFARDAVKSGAEAVIVAGGDGTLNEAIQSVAGTEAAIGYLPFGTVNVWARETGIPLDAESAARVISDGRTESMDLGVAGDRYFMLMAGLGLDGEVLRRARRLERYKQRFGVFPYVAAVLSTTPTYRGADLELRYDGVIRRVRALLLVVGNTRLYGGWFHFTPNAVANDGWLDVCIVKGKTPIDLVRQTLPLTLKSTVKYSDVERLKVREISIGGGPAPLQLDGELLGSTPIQIRVAPRCLNTIVPKGFASSLIA